VENTFSGRAVASSVVGIGLNIYNELPEELLSIATSMRAETGKDFTVEEVTEKLVEELTKPRDMQRYLSYIGFLGKEANLIFQDGVKRGRLVAVDELGGLLVDFDGERVRVTAGEVSLRDFGA
jgi:biotin-(acetyl-CoA carboxylase) ligase